RNADTLEPMTLRKSTLSNTSSSPNSFAARRDNSIHRRLWVLKAHDGESQASNLMLDELLNGTTPVVSKSSAVTTANAPNQHQQQHTTPSTSTTVAADTPPLNIQTTPESISQAPTQAPTVTPTENIIQAEQIKNMHKLTKTNLSTSLVHWYKNEGRHRLVILTRQTCILSVNDILLNIVGQKIIR
ncbi:hypothetical protein Tco_1008682, partial [Tanacetum coccineum]